MVFSRFTSISLCLAAFLIAAHAAPPAVSAAPAPAKTAGTDTSFPAQSSVAAKTTFGTVPESDKSLAAALDAKALTAAAKLAGKPGSFTGMVTKVYSPKNHGFVALDFAANYHNALTANIAPADYAKFPDLMQLEGKRVLVSGTFVVHGTQTQLQVTKPEQIKIVDAKK